MADEERPPLAQVAEDKYKRYHPEDVGIVHYTTGQESPELMQQAQAENTEAETTEESTWGDDE